MPSDKDQRLRDALPNSIAFIQNQILRIGKMQINISTFPLYLVAMKGCAGKFCLGLRSPSPPVMHHKLRALLPYVLSNYCKSHSQW